MDQLHKQMLPFVESVRVPSSSPSVVTTSISTCAQSRPRSFHDTSLKVAPHSYHTVYPKWQFSRLPRDPLLRCVAPLFFADFT